VLHGIPGAVPAKNTLALQWKNADLLEAAIPVAGRETVLNTVEVSGQQPVTLPPVCLPYSPEFAPDQLGRGAATLAQIATTTGGRERLEIPKIWDELPVKSRYVELAPWLLVLAAVLFLLEIFERRTGWVSRFFGWRTVAKAEKENAEADVSEPAAPRKPVMPWLVRKRAQTSTVSAAIAKNVETPAAEPAAAKPMPEKPASTESNIDAMRKARERAQRRTDKER
jgi:hypothetical protein